MVAINPMCGRGKSLFHQMTLPLDFFNPYIVEIQEPSEIINVKRLLKWREKDADTKADS